MLDRIIKKIEENSFWLNGAAASVLESVVGPWFAESFKRVDPVCNQILAAPYDVVCLNEVFDEESRAQFIKRLSREGPFPYYTEVLGDAVPATLIESVLLSNFAMVLGPFFTYMLGNLAEMLKSSGLLLFSRHPLLPISGGEQCRFVKYKDAKDEDWLAPKGGAAVVIQPPGLPKIVLGFTHLQASDGEEYAKIRLKQAAQWIALMVSVAKKTNTSHLLACGDLNVIGEKNLVPTEEYKSFFGADHLFGKLLREQWAETHSGQDAFITHPGDTPPQRLDYVLTGLLKLDAVVTTVRINTLTAHHLMIARNLWAGNPQAPTPFGEPAAPAPGGDLPQSDHYGVNAVINFFSPNCTPRLAQLLKFKNSVAQQVVSVPGGGAYFWLRLDTVGSGTGFLNSTAGDKLEVMIFASTDLSAGILPVKPSNWTKTDQLRLGNRFTLPSPPVFVRVRQPQPTNEPTGGTFTVILARGESKKMALYLPGAQATPATFPKFPEPLNEDDTMWFELRPNRPTVATATQTIQLKVTWKATASTPLQPFDLWLEDESGKPISEKIICQKPNGSGLNIKLLKSKIIYPRLHRRDPAAPPFTIEWRSDLTVLHGPVFAGRQVPNAGPLFLRAADETSSDWWGSDAPYLTVEVDNAPTKTQEYEKVNNGDVVSVNEVTPIAYLKKVELTVGESSKSDDNTLLPLAANSPQPVPQLMQFEVGSGNYELAYNLSHWLEPTTPS